MIIQSDYYFITFIHLYTYNYFSEFDGITFRLIIYRHGQSYAERWAVMSTFFV